MKTLEVIMYKAHHFITPDGKYYSRHQALYEIAEMIFLDEVNTISEGFVKLFPDGVNIYF